MSTEQDYIDAFDELNKIVDDSYYSAIGDEKNNAVKEDFLSLLIYAYQLGIQAASDAIGYFLPLNTDLLEKALYRKFDGLTFEERIDQHIENGDLFALERLAESEFHRLYNAGVMDGGTWSGVDLEKTWNTKRDPYVRETHHYLEGMKVPLQERFYTYDNDSAMFPGDFSKAENNVSCRCWITLSRR